MLPYRLKAARAVVDIASTIRRSGSMRTQIEIARIGLVTSQMEAVATAENVPVDYVRTMVAEGKIVIPRNIIKQSKAVGIGKGLRTKVNASIGTSSYMIDYTAEVRKARAAEAAGADTLMDCSIGGDLNRVRNDVIAAVDIPVGNVPLFQAFCDASRKYGDPNKLDDEMLFDLIEQQCEDGIAFMTMHCGINLYTIERLRKQGHRYSGLVNQGGISMVAWMTTNNRENPLYEKFDRVISILKKYDVVLSLGNGLSAEVIHDSSDRAQIQELVINCELSEIGRDMGCQMLIEGSGYVPLDEIEGNILLQKKMSGGAPYYVPGPISVNVAPGFHDITAAISTSQSSRYGADIVSYITPTEHVAAPNEGDVRRGVQAAKIAAYIGDLIKYPRREDSMPRPQLGKMIQQAFHPEEAMVGNKSSMPK